MRAKGSFSRAASAAAISIPFRYVSGHAVSDPCDPAPDLLSVRVVRVPSYRKLLSLPRAQKYRSRALGEMGFGGTFRQAATRGRVPLPERGGFHELRHHYASLLVASGCSVFVVQKRLGHASAQRPRTRTRISRPMTTSEPSKRSMRLSVRCCLPRLRRRRSRGA